MILNLSDKHLKEALDKFNFNNPPVDPIQIATDLTETMLSHSALGIAANQCGLDYRAFAISSNPVIVCFNPIIVDYSEEQIYLEEGCLSFPNLYIKIKRPKTIKVRYTEPNGNIVTRVFEGMTARVFQHELDHVEGLDFISRASIIHKEQAFKRKKKLDRRK